MKLELGNYKYGVKKTKSGEMYGTRELSKKGFEKWKSGKLENRSGIIENPITKALNKFKK